MLELRDFYFIHHGETDWNREHRGMGQKDIPLNERGLAQAHTAQSFSLRRPSEQFALALWLEYVLRQKLSEHIFRPRLLRFPN